MYNLKPRLGNLIKYSIILFVVALQGCATVEQNRAPTQSGYPEVVIPKRSVKEVHDRMTNIFLEKGIEIQTDRANNIVITKEMDFSRAQGRELVSSFVRGERGSAYTDAVSFALLESPDGTRVIARAYEIEQSRKGQVTKFENKENKTFEEFQKFLNALKNSFN